MLLKVVKVKAENERQCGREDSEETVESNSPLPQQSPVSLHNFVAYNIR